MSEISSFPDKNTPAYARMKSFLSSYVSCKKACEAYEDEKACGLIKSVEKDIRDAFYNECKDRCKKIEDFIASVDLDRDERQLFFLHYIMGMSIENASEKMYVSRSTVFRINKRAEYKSLMRYIAVEGPDRNIS